MFRFYSKILNLGTDRVDSVHSIYVRQANSNGFFFFVVDILLSAMFFFVYNESHLALGLLISGISFLIGSIGFNYLGWTNLSRLSTATIGSIIVAYCAFYLDAGTFTAASLLLGAIFPFVYFSIKEKLYIFLCLLSPYLIYFLLVYFDYQLGPKLEINSPSTLALIRMIMFTVPYAGIFINSWAAIAERDRKTEELYQSKKLIETIFFALSHDLANPVQNISFITNFVNKSDDFNEKRIKSLKTSTHQMLRVFNNLKNIVKVSIDGKSKILLKEHSAESLIKEAIN
ncbi:MAG: hypothetical protein KDD45_06615, partial [Bdellovibrionales bacterium]|nr:hypothetical protein [Bdellovibrionales bacterium]